MQNATKEFIIGLSAFIIMILAVILFAIVVRADDGQFYTACGGGDLQSYIGCFGDEQNSFIGGIPEPLAAFCGDLICNNAETCSTCAVDCGTCPTGGGGPGIIPSGGSGGVLQMSDRLVESHFPKQLNSKEERDLIFNLAGPKIFYTLDSYDLQLVVTSDNGAIISLDQPPAITILDGLNRALVQNKIFTDFSDYYEFKLGSGVLKSAGVYRSIVTVISKGKAFIFNEEWVVELSKDRLALTKVSEETPNLVCNLLISNEGTLQEDFATRYFLVKNEDALYKDSLQGTAFIVRLSPNGVNGTACSIKDALQDPKKVCSYLKDDVGFIVPEHFQGISPYWCKAETCRNWRVGTLPWGDPNDLVKNVCEGGTRSEASKLLNAKGQEVKPVQELIPPPPELSFWDFWFSGASSIWPSSTWFTWILYILILLSFPVLMIWLFLKRLDGLKGAWQRMSELNSKLKKSKRGD